MMSKHDEMMMDLFRAEVESHAESLTNALLALEQDSTATQLIDGMMRAAHSVKGAARIVQIEPAVQVSHVMEDCFVAAQRSEILLKPAGIDVLLKGVDMLKRISEESLRDSPNWSQLQPTIIQLVKALEQVHAGNEPDNLSIVAETKDSPSMEHGSVERGSVGQGSLGHGAFKENPVASGQAIDRIEKGAGAFTGMPAANAEVAIVTIRFPEYLNASAAEKVRLEYLASLQKSEVRKINLDLALTEDIDAIGLAFLDSLASHVSGNEWVEVSITAVSPTAEGVIRFLKAKTLFAQKG